MANIHPQLEKDCFVVGRFELSYLLMMNDVSYPWFILVPDRNNLIEIYQLSASDQQQLMRESSLLAETMVSLFKPDKLNIAAIGNLVPQLHVHHIARYHKDKSWPAPVWGRYPPERYSESRREDLIKQIRQALGNRLGA